MTEAIKRFKEWLGIKAHLDRKAHTPPYFSEGEVWWCHIGENIGIELNGKGTSFSRPILVFKKYDRCSFLGLPLTTAVKKGSWYAIVDFNKTKQTVVLAQGRSLDYKRLQTKIDRLKQADFDSVTANYIDLHLKICPRSYLRLSREIPKVHHADAW